jgi:hypothetical protein
MVREKEKGQGTRGVEERRGEGVVTKNKKMRRRRRMRMRMRGDGTK